MTTVVPKQTIVGFGAFDQPFEACNDVCTRRLTVVFSVVSQNAHVIFVLLETIIFRHKLFQIVHIIDAATQLGAGAKIIDSHKQRLLVACASRFGNVQAVIQFLSGWSGT